MSLGLFIFLRIAFLDGGDELGELGLVFWADFGDGDGCCCL